MKQYALALLLYLLLAFLCPEVEADDASALLERACEPAQASVCRFYCWRISEIVDRAEASPSEFYFTVQFEDDDGNLLVGGDNVTPRVCDPAGCTHSEYGYIVVKTEDKFLVDGIPVFTGCWP